MTYRDMCLKRKDMSCLGMDILRRDYVVIDIYELVEHYSQSMKYCNEDHMLL